MELICYLILNLEKIRKLLDTNKLSINDIIRGNTYGIVSSEIVNSAIISKFIPIVIKDIENTDDFEKYIENIFSFHLSENLI